MGGGKKRTEGPGGHGGRTLSAACIGSIVSIGMGEYVKSPLPRSARRSHDALSASLGFSRRTASPQDSKPHRQFPFTEILDALEFDMPPKHKDPAHATSPPPQEAVPEESADAYTFKIVTTRRD